MPLNYCYCPWCYCPWCMKEAQLVILPQLILCSGCWKDVATLHLYLEAKFKSGRLVQVNVIFSLKNPFISQCHALKKVYCTAKNFRQRKTSSKSTVRQFVRNLFSSNVGSFVCFRSFGSLAYRLSSHSWLFLIPHLLFCGKFSQEFNLVKKLLWRKRRN